MEGLGLFIAASVGLTVAASKRQQHCGQANLAGGLLLVVCIFGVPKHQLIAVCTRSEPDYLEGLIAATENYPGDKTILASIIHVLSATVHLLLEMPLAFVVKEQTNLAKNWSVKGIDREWLAMEWKRCAMKRIKVQWTAVVIDFVALAPVTPAVRHHADALLAALEAEDVDSDGEGDSEFVDGVYLHYKKKCKV